MTECFFIASDQARVEIGFADPDIIGAGWADQQNDFAFRRLFGSKFIRQIAQCA